MLLLSGLLAPPANFSPTHNDPPKPRSWPIVPVFPSAAGRGTKTRRIRAVFRGGGGGCCCCCCVPVFWRGAQGHWAVPNGCSRPVIVDQQMTNRAHPCEANSRRQRPKWRGLALDVALRKPHTLSTFGCWQLFVCGQAFICLATGGWFAFCACALLCMRGSKPTKLHTKDKPSCGNAKDTRCWNLLVVRPSLVVQVCCDLVV